MFEAMPVDGDDWCDARVPAMLRHICMLY
jgi:hypothetical protein